MDECNDSPRIVFLHIPKTGGTTLHNVLSAHFRPEQIWPQADPNIGGADPEVLRRYRLFSAHFPMAAVDLIPHPKIVVTLMRRPRDRILSMYYYWRAHRAKYPDRPDLAAPRAAQHLDLLAFLRCQDHNVPHAIRNPVVTLLTGQAPAVQTKASLDRAIEVLSTIDVVGDFATYDQAVSAIVTRCNLPQPSGVPRLNAAEDIKPEDKVKFVVDREPITPEIEAELARVSDLDDQLYAFAVNVSLKQAARAEV